MGDAQRALGVDGEGREGRQPRLGQFDQRASVGHKRLARPRPHTFKDPRRT